MQQHTTQETSTVLELSTPHGANLAFGEGVYWDLNCVQTTLYDRSIRMRQCFTCQRYRNQELPAQRNPRCVFSAEGYQSPDCPCRNTRNHGAKCRGAHAASSEQCENRSRTVAESENTSLLNPHFHPIPCPFLVAEPSVNLALSTS